MDILNSFITNQKRKLTEDKKKIDSSGSRKYIRRGEFDRIRAEEYRKEQEEKEKEKMKDVDEPVEESSDRSEEVEKENEKQLLPAEVISRLKMRGEPITLFGEEDEDRLNRLLKLEERKPFNYNNSNGFDFLEAMKREGDIYDLDPLVKMRKTLELEDPDFKIEDREPEGDCDHVWFFLREQLEEMRLELEEMPVHMRRTDMGPTLNHSLTIAETS
eukprot:TRINITY_DN3440_c0_g1_i2.p1 TRINITY_DN3440_c0_g1~~TRINITY_DN3440_c0_g1_i2.p1  ORF type:complete len:216 (-),score=68.62 TRINITY_DN3440_c0_g1_i2:402-1049(-)